MDYITLREICRITGVSRRAVQGYEKAGLVSSTTKNERGYLLYDMEAKDRIQLIRLLQQLGFTVKEIYEVLNQSKSEMKQAIMLHIETLESRKEEIDALIEKAYCLIEGMESEKLL